MKNVIVANYRDSKKGSAKRYPKEALETELKAQIDNSLELGWDPKDLWVVTNFSFCHNGIGSFSLPLNEKCLTGSKSFAMRELFKAGMVTDNIWIHDLDAWQCVPFKMPKIKDVGIANYSRPKYNGGSVFYTPNSQDIVESICSMIESTEDIREEPAITHILKKEYPDRTTEVDYGFNLGCSGFRDRYSRAEKPIKVVHFHPSNRMAWDTHVRNRNNISEDASIPKRLKDLFLRYWGDLIRGYTYEDTAYGGDPLKTRFNWSGTRYENPSDKKISVIKDPEGNIAVIGSPERKLTNLELVDMFMSLDTDTVTDIKKLALVIRDKVGLSLNTRVLNIDDKRVVDCWGGLQAKQFPEELAGLLNFMYLHIDEINTYYEIGVERGGTFFTVDSFLRAFNPNYEGSLGVDLSDKIEKKHNLTEYVSKYENCAFRCISSTDLALTTEVDFILIDGDHSYDGVKKDYEHVKNKGKYIAFHDIHLKGSGVERFWKEIWSKYNYSTEIINTNLDDFPLPIGIGIIWGGLKDEVLY